ncbi:GIY-YIG nuclease family protein [Agrobacterium rosae]|uniref:GIY-YIG nuclease family protein n=1 Tax=Agrobacterium rosae TaxID=1972867 RepID=UPI003B9F00E2
MNEQFRQHVEALHPKFEELIAMPPIKGGIFSEVPPARGVYLFSEGENHLYVGRTNRLRQRYKDHCRPSSDHNSAPFAFKLARHATNNLARSYVAGPLSRKGLSANPDFAAAFVVAKARVAAMDFRYVGEDDANRQCLLEIYCAIALSTRYNDFDNN